MKTAKNTGIKILFLCIIISFSCYKSEASHLFGGEITWKCLSNGHYLFQLKLYFDCNSGGQIPMWGSIDVYGHPTVCSIPINSALTQINDLSPSSCMLTCASGGPGTTLELVFTSDTVSLPGNPPTTGWVFAINDCCRNNLNNLGAGQGFTLRSIMYPYNNTSTDPCFDSSPFFAERPSTSACIGYPFTYNPNAIDAERDSLVYSWANCLDVPASTVCSPFVSSAIAFLAPYSLINQLPGSPTLNSLTGEINFFVSANAATIGNFVTCIKVTAYRCGVKIAEVYRDCGFTLVNGCLVQGLPAPVINTPPAVTPPFIDPNTGLQTSFADTVVAGDSVSFNFSATDFQLNLDTNNLLQTVTLNATGDYFGTGFTDATSGCTHPPCATLTPPPPVVNSIVSTMQFNWATSCNLINNIQACTDNIYSTFYFVLTAKDNACSANGASVATISITVTGPEIQHSNDSIWIHYNGATSYQWYVDGVLIPGATDSLYVIGIPGLFYSCQVATSGGCTLSSRLYFPPVGMHELSFIRSLSVAPNPAKEKFTLHIGSADTKNADVVFTDITGRSLLSEKLQLKTGNNTFEYSTAKFFSGIYFVKAGDGTRVVTKKIVIQ